MEFGEGTAKVKFKQDDPNDTREKIKIRIGVFFDGTFNNVTNINQRLMSAQSKDLTQEERYAAEDLKHGKDDKELKKAKKTYKKYGAPGEDNSYEGYYTNVYKLYQYTDDTLGMTPDYNFVAKVYVDGPGTIEKGGDETAGFAFAMGPSGVPAKVADGVKNVFEKITKIAPDQSKIIELLSIDVYGFSRGAAGARKFINDALFGRRFVFAGGSLGGPDHATSIRAQLENAGYTILAPGPKTGVKVCLAGLFDTVSTYGLGVVVDEDDNVDALSLNAVFHAEETLHLTAAEEHRYHFSLTNTQSAGSRGKQYFLPGVHSDIGGGYRDDGDEEQPILGSFGFTNAFILQACEVTPEMASEDVRQLIEAGWFKHNEFQADPDANNQAQKNKISIETEIMRIQTPGMMKSGIPPRHIERSIVSTARYGLRNTYSTIPLQIMVKSAKDKGILFLPKLELNEAVPTSLNDENGYIQSYIDKQGPYSSQAADWVDNRDPWLKKMRHDYFHFSARMRPGHDPRIENGKRVRKIYRG
jgi:hypothetical protein